MISRIWCVNWEYCDVLWVIVPFSLCIWNRKLLHA